MRLIAIIICFALSLLSAPAFADVQAVKVTDFTNIFCVEGQIASWIALYTNSPSAVVADAQYLGVKRWRDGLGAQEPGQIAVLQALVNAGISLIGIPLQHQAITVADHISKAKVWAGLGANALYALEGPNEPVNFPITYNGVSTGPAGNPTTFTPVAQFQRDYYIAIKADSVLHSIPVWSVTQVGAEPNNVGLQYLTIPTPLPSGVLMPAGTVFADAANMHVYPMFNGGAQTIDPTKDRIKQELYAGFSRTYHLSFAGYTQVQADALPKVITEFGYAASGGTPNGSGTDTTTQGKNLLTGFMNAWSEGYTLINIYELYDEGDGFGIFSGHANPKLAATYIHNFMTVISDSTSQNFAPGALAFSFSGLPSTGRSQLFRKSNGNYELVLWNNVNNWNFAAGTPISISPTSVAVNLGATASSIKYFDPTVGTGAVQSVSNLNTITVSLKDYPIVVEIVPLSGTPIPTASLTANPTSITSGNSSTLSWSSTNATSCTGTGFSTANATSGSASVSPSVTTTYSMTCNGAGGSVTKTAKVRERAIHVRAGAWPGISYPRLVTLTEENRDDTARKARAQVPRSGLRYHDHRRVGQGPSGAFNGRLRAAGHGEAVSARLMPSERAEDWLHRGHYGMTA